MNQEQYNCWKLVVQSIGVGISAVVAVVVVVYTRETRKLRISTEEQIRLLQAQSKLAVRPFITGRLQLGEAAGAPYCFIWNATDKVAHQIGVLAKSGGNHFWSENDT